MNQIFADYAVTRENGIVTVFWDFEEQKRSFYLVFNENGRPANQPGSVILNHNLHGVADSQRDINRVLFTLISNARHDLGRDDFYGSSEEYYDPNEGDVPESIFARFVIATKR